MALAACTPTVAGSHPSSAARSTGPSMTGDSASSGSPVNAGGPLGLDDLVGTWEPVVLLGRGVKTNPSAIGVRFRDNGRAWTGSNGCNLTSGPFRLGPSGAFSATARTTTSQHCSPARVNNASVAVIVRATRLLLQAGRLSFYDAHGQRIGVYVRAT